MLCKSRVVLVLALLLLCGCTTRSALRYVRYAFHWCLSHWILGSHETDDSDGAHIPHIVVWYGLMTAKEMGKSEPVSTLYQCSL